MNRSRVSALLTAFQSKRILVIGDLILDEFIWGKVSRISPEAPVPVVEVSHNSWYPGGAANVGRNLREFATDIRMMGVTGCCSHADHLKRLLTENGIDVSAVQSHDCYQTIVKTRVIARQQHLVRIDRERPLRLQPEHIDLALGQLAAMLPDIDAVIVEDYGKGMLPQEFTTAICDLTNRAGKILAVDPEPRQSARLEARHCDEAEPLGGICQRRAPADGACGAAGSRRQLAGVGGGSAEMGRGESAHHPRRTRRPAFPRG
jgi:D-beta-D-heptose 7-phosphate kinase/D-beta-D-heptose 1-phosphate adenosyltransferase